MSITRRTRKMFADKRRYRRYKRRTERLPASHRAAIEALERYLYVFGPGTGDGVLDMLDDLVDLFEQSAAGGVALREIVGEDPAEFADAFVANYPQGGWITRERERVNRAVAQAVEGTTTQGGGA